jgi:MFS family permease
VVVALFALVFAVAIPLASFGVFLPVLAAAFGWSRGAISVALSINMITGGIAGFWIGVLADRYGPRAVLGPTILLAGTGFALASTIGALWQFYLCIGVLVGIGNSSIYVISAATIVRWFDEDRGLVLGLVLTGLNLGFAAGGPVSAVLIDGIGWRGAYLTLAVLVCAVAGLASLFVVNPARPILVTDTGAVRRVGSYGPPGADSLNVTTPGFTFAEALASPRLWYLATAWMLLGFVFMLTTVHIVPYARDRGISLESASLALTAYGIGAIAGRILVGMAADRLGVRPLMRWCFAVQFLAFVPLLAGPPGWAVTLLLLAFGFGFAGADTLLVTVVPEVVGLRAIGAAMGVLNFGWRLGAALGPATAGFVYDATGSYLLAFAVAAAFVVAGFVLSTFGARPARP